MVARKGRGRPYRPDPRALAPGLARSAHPNRMANEGEDPRARRAISTPAGGLGHFVKMVHNGIEYGLMQAYAEGFDILKGKRRQAAEDERFDLNLTDIAEVCGAAA